MHLHRIDCTTHHAFLQEARQDPVTGDVIKSGDTVVFCAACKSVFLQETWEYLGNTHCHQQETLPQIPTEKHLNIRSNAFDLYRYRMRFRCDIDKDIDNLRGWKTKTTIFKKTTEDKIKQKKENKKLFIKISFMILTVLNFVLFFLTLTFNIFLIEKIILINITFLTFLLYIYLTVFFTDKKKPTRELLTVIYPQEDERLIWLNNQEICLLEKSMYAHISMEGITQVLVSGYEDVKDTNITLEIAYKDEQQQAQTVKINIYLTFEDAKNVIDALKSWAKKTRVIIHAKKLPTFGRMGEKVSELLSYIYFLYNYRDAKFEFVED
ncbi:hypothetical protein [Hugenholtzia roseola]|uniref:hypothetical protein n=1 Tax=Hugenholtzia roseola TaxID=1002 RepID=UPI000403E65B|nr:hypothetical protein [Hugenholtzia roseola]